MNSIALSDRLLAIASFIPKAKRVADIGSDHALLPSYLVLNEIAPFAIAGEVNEGPFRAAEKQIREIGLKEKISVRKGNGLEVIKDKNEVDVITIAGMGGALIVQILSEGIEKLSTIQRLVLQPNVGEELVRKWLDVHNWNIIDEEIIEENEKIYEMIVAEPESKIQDGDPYKGLNRTKEELYRLGPILWKKQSPILMKKWKRELQKIEYILKQLESAVNEKEKQNKKEDYLKEQRWVLEVIKCLQKDRR